MGGCQPRIEVILKMQKKKFGGGRGDPVRGRSEGGCEPRIEVILKMKKVVGAGSGGGGSGGLAWRM